MGFSSYLRNPSIRSDISRLNLRVLRSLRLQPPDSPYSECLAKPCLSWSSFAPVEPVSLLRRLITSDRCAHFCGAGAQPYVFHASDYRFTASRRAANPTALQRILRHHLTFAHSDPLDATIAIPARQRAKRSAEHLFRFGDGFAFPFVRKRIGSLLVETKIRIQRPKGTPTPCHLDRW